MKKRSGLIGLLTLILFVVALAACASTAKQASTGEYVDDTVITTKVKSMLAADDFLKSFQIGVETYKGVVQLSGFVDSQTAVAKAVKIAKGVQGVNSVKDDLIVK
jgi:osmotically-inducible protein OsmY